MARTVIDTGGNVIPAMSANTISSDGDTRCSAAITNNTKAMRVGNTKRQHGRAWTALVNKAPQQRRRHAQGNQVSSADGATDGKRAIKRLHHQGQRQAIDTRRQPRQDGSQHDALEFAVREKSFIGCEIEQGADFCDAAGGFSR